MPWMNPWARFSLPARAASDSRQTLARAGALQTDQRACVVCSVGAGGGLSAVGAFFAAGFFGFGLAAWDSAGVAVAALGFAALLLLAAADLAASLSVAPGGLAPSTSLALVAVFLATFGFDVFHPA